MNAEKTIREFFERMMDGSKLVVYLKDADGRYLYVNPRYEAVSTLPRERILGRLDAELFPPDIAKTFQEQDAEVLRRRGPIEFEETLSLPGGERTFLTEKVPVFDEQGRLCAVGGFCAEITASERFLTDIVENVPNMIFVKDAKDLRFVRFNKAGEELLGRGRETLIGRNDYDFFPKDEADFFTGKDREVLSSRRLLDIPEEKIQTAGKGERLLHTKKIPILGSDGEPRYLLGISEDITERKKMEETQRLMQKLESLGVLAGGIAHDFNNLLTGITGSLSLLSVEMGADAERSDILREALAACQTAKGLARQLLTFASGGEPIVRCEEMTPFVKEAALFAVRGSNSKCEFAIGPEPVFGWVDKDQIMQVVQNLVINAAQAMPMGGRIQVGLEAVDLAEDALPGLPSGRYVRLSVEDEGIGIPEALRPRIFDPYFSTKSKGRGLGLAVCHSIVTKHGGHIGLAAASEKGTAFVVHLPAAAAPAARSDAEGPAARRFNGRRFLVMDDEAAVGAILRRMLTRLGAEMELAPDGASALEVWRKARGSDRPFDALIADLTIPGGMGGKETAARLKREQPDARIIVSSGYSEDPVLVAPADHGFCAVLVKPYRLEDLAAVLSKALEG